MIKNKVKFFECETCGNIVTILYEGGGQLVCCGKPMKELKPNTTDGAMEKHVPFVTVIRDEMSCDGPAKDGASGDALKVVVGEVPHPMLEEHYIRFVALETTCGLRVKWLNPGDKPEVCFRLALNDKPVRVYEFCSLHGLWVKELAF